MDPLISALQNATSSAALKAAVDALPREKKYYTAQVRDLILQKQQFIVDSPTADSVMYLFDKFTDAVANRPLLRTPEIRDLIINILAPAISEGDAVANLGAAIWGIAQDKPSAELYSTPESFKALLSCFHRATTAESAQWIASSINNILLNNPTANKLLNDLPVVEAFSAVILYATSDGGARTVSDALQVILLNNDEAQKMFGTPTFLKLFKSIEKFATSDNTKASFKKVVDILQSIVTRRMEEPLGDATTSQELTSALDAIIEQSDCWSTLVDLLLSKQHLIQDEESTTTTAKFINMSWKKNEKSIRKMEIFDLFQNILLPKSLNFPNTIPHVHEALALIVKNKEAQEFFSTPSFKEYIVASLPHSNKSVLKLLNSLLDGNKKGQEIFGTPDFKEKFENKFAGDISQDFFAVMKFLNDHIVQVRFDALKKLVADHKEAIDEVCLKKLAKNEIDVADLLVVELSSVITQLQFTVKQNVVLSRIIQKMKDKNNGVPVHQDPFKLQQLEQLRQEHNDLRKLHQDLVTSSSKSNDDLKNQLQDEKQKLAATVADRDAKQLQITGLDQNLVDEKKTSSDLADANKKLAQEHNDLRKLHQDLVTSSSKAIDDLEKLQQSVAHELDAEKKKHLATTTERDAKIIQIVDLEKSRDHTKKLLQTAQQEIGLLQSQLDAISPFVRDKFYQIDSNVNNLPPPQAGVVERHPVAEATRIFAEAEKLMKKGGTLIYDATSPNEFKFSPVKGFTLQSIDVILRGSAGFEERMAKLQGLRLNVTDKFNPAFAAFSPEQQQILKVLFEHFLPRPPNANPKFPNLVNVFHGTRVDRLDAAMNGLVAMRSTDDGFFGFGVYATTSIEYAAQYARGDFSPIASPPRADGCYPVLWCVAAVGVCHPVSRADDYSKNRVHTTNGRVSNFFGSPLNKDCDCHCAIVGGSQAYQAVPPKDMEYMEIVVDQEAQVIPIAVLWVKP